MQTITNIIRQELRERLFSWITLIFFLMMVFQGIWYTKGTFDYYVNEGVLMNAPSIFYRNFAGMGMLMIIIIAISTGNVLYKDIQYKSAQWVYALPVSEKQFFVGRYLAAFLYLSIVSTGFFAGMLLVPYSGIGEAHRFGPAPLGQMLHGMLIFTLPNLLLYTSMVFFAIVFSRKMVVGYLAVFLVVIFFLIMQTAYDAGNTSTFYILGDPNGYVTAQYYSDLLSTADKNTAYFALKGYLLQNRLIWLALAAVLFVLSYRKFSFKYFITAGTSSSKTLKDNIGGNPMPSTSAPRVARAFNQWSYVKKLFSLSRIEFLNIVRPTAFRIILVIMLIMIVLQNVTWNANYYIGPEIPLSSNMTYFRLQWGVFIMMLLMIWSGELFFKDKTVNIWQITDALPVPVWVSQISKYFAALAVAFTLCVAFILTGIACQIMMGGAAYIDLGRYAEDLIGFRWGFLNFALYITLVFFVAGLTGNRLITHILCVGYFLLTIISFDMGLFEQVRFGYGLVPGIEDYSEMSGYGIFRKAGNWFFLTWLASAVALLLAGVLFWDRGVGQRWYRKLLLKGKQLSIAGKVVMLCSILAFFMLQSFINIQVYSNGNFKAEETEEHEDAAYERRYKYLEKMPKAKYREVDLSLDYFPEERKAIYVADIKLKKRSDVDTLYLNWEQFVDVKEVLLAGAKLAAVKSDVALNVEAYLLPESAKSDSILSLSISAEKRYDGFSQSDFQEDLMFDGSFGSIRQFLPYIGYRSDRELTENRKREDNGLARLESRMAPVSDKMALGNDAYAPDADWVTGSITVSTTSRQVAAAPGKMMSHQQKNGRSYYNYKIESPAPFNWFLGSATYHQSKNGTVGKTRYAIWHKPEHTYNISSYDDALRKGLAFVGKLPGGYPYDEVRLIEINHLHDDEVTAFANTIAISEKHGWVADLNGLKEKAYLYQTVGAGLARHWIGQHFHIADVQGADMIKVALPEAYGLLFVEQTLGTDAAELLLKKKMDKYAKDRNNEPNKEPTLVYADGADYLEINKGAVELYRAMQALGVDKFSEITNNFAGGHGHTIVFKDYYDTLLNHSGNRPAMHNNFESVAR